MRREQGGSWDQTWLGTRAGYRSTAISHPLRCSDGLTKHVTDERIAEVLGSMTSARQAAEQLLQDAPEGGGTDNVTVVVSRSVPRKAACATR